MKVIEDSGNFGMSIWNWETDQLNFSQITKWHAAYLKEHTITYNLFLVLA